MVIRHFLPTPVSFVNLADGVFLRVLGMEVGLKKTRDPGMPGGENRVISILFSYGTSGSTENAGPKNNGPNIDRRKMQDWKMTDQIARSENAGPENAGLENDGLEFD